MTASIPQPMPETAMDALFDALDLILPSLAARLRSPFSRGSEANVAATDSPARASLHETTQPATPLA